MRLASVGYGSLAALCALVSIAKLPFPAEYLAHIYGITSATPAQLSAVRVSAFGLLPFIAALFSLKEAAAHERLKSATYRRLNVAVILFGIGYLGYSVAGTSAKALSTSGSICTGSIAVAALILPILAHQSGTGTSALSVLKEFAAGLPKAATPHGGTLSTFYVASAGALSAWAAGLLARPHSFSVAAFLHQGGLAAAGELIWASFGVCLLPAAVVSLVLKDAAERGHLGASTFRTLNIGLAAMSAGVLGVMVSDLFRAVTAGCPCCQTGLWQSVTSYWAYPAVVLLVTFLTSTHSYITAKA